MDKTQQAAFTMRLTRGGRVCFAVYYDHSVIVACLEKSRKKELQKQIKGEIKALAIPLLKWGDFTETAWERYGDRYLHMNTEETICESNQNFEIRYGDIEKVRLSPYRTETTRSYEDPPIMGQIWFEVYGEKHHFNHKYKREHPKVGMLRELFADRFTLVR